MPILNKDMTLCISLAARPSNLGTRFHNYLYEELGLNFIYKAFTTEDIEGAIRGVRALGIRGCSVSMPFKEAVIPLVDELDPSALASCTHWWAWRWKTWVSLGPACRLRKRTGSFRSEWWTFDGSSG